MRFWMLEGEIEASANVALQRVRAALAGAGATIVDARQLGGLALVLRFECDDDQAAAILAGLEAVLALRAGREMPGPGKGEIHGSLHLTLVGSGDVKVDIPAVPG